MFSLIGGLCGFILLLLHVYVAAYGFGDAYCVQVHYFPDRAKELGINAAELYKTGMKLAVQQAYLQHTWPCLGPPTIGGAVIGWIITIWNASLATSPASDSSCAKIIRTEDKEVPMNKEERSEFISTKQPIQEKT
ncbi:MAG: hypothetical protein K2W95_22800 [Candidatus Obscuribacterales bacterium]|nr:hypothetical protein [Candidatus Obscuribacterales bacterium]